MGQLPHYAPLGVRHWSHRTTHSAKIFGYPPRISLKILMIRYYKSCFRRSLYLGCLVVNTSRKLEILAKKLTFLQIRDTEGAAKEFQHFCWNFGKFSEIFLGGLILRGRGSQQHKIDFLPIKQHTSSKFPSWKCNKKWILGGLESNFQKILKRPVCSFKGDFIEILQSFSI